MLELVAYLSPSVVSLVMAVELEFSLNRDRQLLTPPPRKAHWFFFETTTPPAHAVVIAVVIVVVKAEHITMPQTASAPSSTSPPTNRDGKLQKTMKALLNSNMSPKWDIAEIDALSPSSMLTAKTTMLPLLSTLSMIKNLLSMFSTPPSKINKSPSSMSSAVMKNSSFHPP